MQLSLSNEALGSYVVRQIENLFPDSSSCDLICEYIAPSLDRVEFCFSRIFNPYFNNGTKTSFNHLNSDQYAMFLYFLSNTIYREVADVSICEKIFYLNKVLHGIDVFYSVVLPDIFLFSHPLGTVLGRAKYSNYFLVYQNCTIGSSHDVGDYPVMGKYVAVYRGSSVLGNCQIGDNCKIAADSLVMDCNLPDDSLYIGKPGNYSIKRNEYNDRIWYEP